MGYDPLPQGQLSCPGPGLHDGRDSLYPSDGGVEVNGLTRYRSLSDKMLSGDHISWEGRSLLAWAIQRWSHRNHSSMIFRPGEFASLKDRRWIIEADEGEVNVRLLSRRLEGYKGKVFWHALRPEFDLYRGDIENFLNEQIGKPYDYHGLFANALGHIRQKQDEFICSELATAAYMECIPRNLLIKFLPNDQIARMLLGEVLRPGEVATLPIFEDEMQIL